MNLALLSTLSSTIMRIKGKLYDKNRRKYYDAIQSVRENEMDMTTWLEHFSEGLSTQLVDVKTKGEKAIKRDVLHEKIRIFNLNPRQKKALDFLIEHKLIDNSTYQKICDTTKRTATRDFTDLVNLGLLERHGEKKGTYYTLKLFE